MGMCAIGWDASTSHRDNMMLRLFAYSAILPTIIHINEHTLMRIICLVHIKNYTLHKTVIDTGYKKFFRKFNNSGER